MARLPVGPRRRLFNLRRVLIALGWRRGAQRQTRALIRPHCLGAYHVRLPRASRMPRRFASLFGVSLAAGLPRFLFFFLFGWWDTIPINDSPPHLVFAHVHCLRPRFFVFRGVVFCFPFFSKGGKAKKGRCVGAAVAL